MSRSSCGVAGRGLERALPDRREPVRRLANNPQRSTVARSLGGHSDVANRGENDPPSWGKRVDPAIDGLWCAVAVHEQEISVRGAFRQVKPTTSITARTCQRIMANRVPAFTGLKATWEAFTGLTATKVGQAVRV